MTEQEFDESGGCNCHQNPPCSFCESLDEDEYNAWANGGMKALGEFIIKRDGEES